MNSIDRFYEDYVEISCSGQFYVAVVFVSPECAAHLDKSSVVAQFQQTVSRSQRIFAPFEQFSMALNLDGEAPVCCSRSLTVCYILKPRQVEICTHQGEQSSSLLASASYAVRDFSALFCNAGHVKNCVVHNRHEFQIFLNLLLMERKYLYLMKKLEDV